jgi:creatinine amidohydrolase
VAEVQLADLTWPEAEALRSEPDAIGLVPLAAVEQHGRHLPLSTDVDLAQWVAAEVARSLDEPVLVAPVLPGGISRQHMRFPGSVTIPESVLEGYVDAYLDTFAAVGISFVAVFSAHGGNFPFIVDAVPRLAARHPELAVAGYGDLHRFLAVLVTAAKSAGLAPPATDIHAGAIETSMMLSLLPEKYRAAARNEDEYADDFPPSDWIDRMRRDGVHSLSTSGVLGASRLADEQAGRVILAAWVADLVTWIRTESGARDSAR